MPTLNGNGWDLLHPSPEIDWMNIAGALAKICRFNGQCQSFYSVAQHCSLVASLMPPQWRLYGLLHDAHEAFVGDITRPMQEALSYSYDRHRQIATAHDQVIYAAVGLAWPIDVDIKQAVHFADNKALATEWRDLIYPDYPAPFGLPEPNPRPIKPLPWPKAMEQWLDDFSTYSKTIETKEKQ